MSIYFPRYSLLFVVSLLASLLPGDERILALLEASIEEGRTGMGELKTLLDSPPPAASLESILASRDRERLISGEIEELLCAGASVPMDRDEIEVLARALGGISRGIKKFALRYQLCATRVEASRFEPQIERLQDAVNTVAQMVMGLRRPKLATTKPLHDTLHQIEAEADKLFITLIMDLQKRQHEPIAAIMLRDLYELLERVIDRCRTAGNIILRLVLKHT